MGQGDFCLSGLKVGCDGVNIGRRRWVLVGLGGAWLIPMVGSSKTRAKPDSRDKIGEKLELLARLSGLSKSKPDTRDKAIGISEILARQFGCFGNYSLFTRGPVKVGLSEWRLSDQQGHA